MKAGTNAGDQVSGSRGSSYGASINTLLKSTLASKQMGRCGRYEIKRKAGRKKIQLHTYDKGHSPLGKGRKPKLSKKTGCGERVR